MEEAGFLMWSNKYLLSYLLSSEYSLMLMKEALKFNPGQSRQCTYLTGLNDMKR